MERVDQSTTTLPVICDENELKYKTAQCLFHLKQGQEAITVIESVPLKQRSAKLHFLYAQLNKDRAPTKTVLALKEVLKEHQLALDVAEQLLEMGVSGLEVNSLIVDATNLPQCKWLANWIEAHGFLSAYNYSAALKVFKQLKNDSPIQNHHRLLVQIGKCYFYDGYYDLARRTLEMARTECPHLGGEGIILLANLYCRDNRLADLESLLAAISVGEYRHEHWFILALRLYYSDHFERVECFLERARGKHTFLDIEVALLKATVYITCQKYDQALMELRGIMKVAEHRFDLYKKLVEVSFKKGKPKDAEFYASMARQALGKTPRTLFLFAKCQESDPALQAQYKDLLWRIHKMDPNYMLAIDALVEVLVKDKDYVEAEKLLRHQLTVQPNTKIATRMGDICTRLGAPGNALEFYNMAVRLDPTNQKAINALNNMSMDSKRACGDLGNSSVVSEKRANNSVDTAFDYGSLVGDVSVGVQNHSEGLFDDPDDMNNN